MKNPIYYIKRIVSILRNNSFSEVVYKTRCRIERYRHPELNGVIEDSFLEFIISEKHKHLLCNIQKNGSSSWCASIVRYDYNDEFDENMWIWTSSFFWEKYAKDVFRKYINPLEVNPSLYKQYRKVIVLRNPLDRFVSLINHSYRIGNFRGFLDKNLPIEQYIDQFIKYFPLLIDPNRPDRRFEKHLIPQRVFYTQYKALFGNDLEVVMIEDLPSYYKSISGNELFKQNESDKEGRLCTKKDLSVAQRGKICEYIKKYEFCKDDEFTRFFDRYTLDL